MGNLLDSGIITEQECGSAFLYIMSDGSLFLPTEYKVLQGQNDSCFLKCMKMMYNGKVMLCYMPGALVPLDSVIKWVDAKSFTKVVAGYISAILKVKSNGFLTFKNIETDFNKIYVDQNSGAVYLVYVPCARHNFDDYYSFEETVRYSLANAIEGNERFNSEDILRLKDNLRSQAMSLESIYMGLGNRAVITEERRKEEGTPKKKDRTTKMLLTSINAPQRHTIEITKEEYIIGKNPNIVDGVIPYNKAVSRRHCAVVHREGSYYIADLESSNGTYVNGVRLVPKKLCPVKNGDQVRLADSDFRVEIV